LPDSSVDIEINVEIINANSSQEEVELINNVQIGEEEQGDEYSMTIYFVKQGDSLWKIAKKFKSTINEITNINEIENENKINVGDKLYIPRAI
jgi:LysM repeat protein